MRNTGIKHCTKSRKDNVMNTSSRSETVQLKYDSFEADSKSFWWHY